MLLFMTISISGILYKNMYLGEIIWQNDLILLSAFCQNAVFGNMSVHPFRLSVALTICLSYIFISLFFFQKLKS
jgi:hypothetical protein